MKLSILSSPFRLLLVAAFATLQLASQAGIARAASVPIAPFPLNEVRLTSSTWLDAEKRDGDYLLSLDPDRLLFCFRVTAGLPASGASYGAFEDAECELRGHVAGGHYLSALALMYSSTGDIRFKDRGDLMVSELAKCQAANGYLSAFPESLFDRVEANKPVWAPYYTVHKIFAGLLDQYEWCGSQQALEMAKKLAFYFEKRNEKFDAKKMAIVLENEAGGFVESLWNLYGISKDEKIKAFAEKFEKSVFIQPLMKSEDKLTSLHGNTHIPLVIASMRRYELTGEARYLELSKYFWERVVDARGWATGGTAGPREHWGEAFKLAGIMSLTTHETCKTYNLLRLARKLFEATGDPRYADYYNRAHLNGILGTQGPELGQFEYYVPMATGYHRWYGFPDKCMWCCYGSGMESFSKLAGSVFFHTDDAIYINEFIPCVLDWKEKNFQLAIETKYPEEETVHFVIKSGSGKLTLRILQPSWAGKGVTLSVNGKDAPLKVENGFMIVDRPWQMGDKVSVKFPMSLRTIPLPDDPQQVAIAYGPVVLAGIVDKPKERAFMTRDAGAMQPDSEKMKKAYYFIAESRDNLSWLKPVAGKPLHFQATGQPFDIEFQPFYSVTSERYGIYWPVLAKGSEREKGMILQSQAIDLLRAMDAYKAGDPTLQIEQGFAKFLKDKAVSAYYEQLRIGMGKVFKTSGQNDKAADTLKTLTAPFIGSRSAPEIMAVVGDEAESKGMRPLLLDKVELSADASAERDIVDGVPVVKTKSARARFLYLGFTPKGRAALARKNISVTMKYRCDSIPVLQYSGTAPYMEVKPTKIEPMNGWKIATFDCPSVQFTGQQNLDADMRITASDATLLMLADLKIEDQPLPTTAPAH